MRFGDILKTSNDKYMVLDINNVLKTGMAGFVKTYTFSEINGHSAELPYLYNNNKLQIS